MNKTDYKEIAKIIKKLLYMNQHNFWGVKTFVDNLVDYFERTTLYENGIKPIFNKKQFLKEVGVE